MHGVSLPGRRLAVASLLALVLFAAACAPRAATIVPFPGTPTAQCAKQEVLPTITEVRPAPIHPDDEVTVIASGGYFRDSCGGYDESARAYQIYLDDEPAGMLSCYVNHCEGKLVLPEAIVAGAHCLGVQKGTCQMEMQVTSG